MPRVEYQSDDDEYDLQDDVEGQDLDDEMEKITVESVDKVAPLKGLLTHHPTYAVKTWKLKAVFTLEEYMKKGIISCVYDEENEERDTVVERNLKYLNSKLMEGQDPYNKDAILNDMCMHVKTAVVTGYSNDSPFDFALDCGMFERVDYMNKQHVVFGIWPTNGKFVKCRTCLNPYYTSKCHKNREFDTIHEKIAWFLKPYNKKEIVKSHKQLVVSKDGCGYVKSKGWFHNALKSGLFCHDSHPRIKEYTEKCEAVEKQKKPLEKFVLYGTVDELISMLDYLQGIRDKISMGTTLKMDIVRPGRKYDDTDELDTLDLCLDREKGQYTEELKQKWLKRPITIRVNIVMEKKHI